MPHLERRAGFGCARLSWLAFFAVTGSVMAQPQGPCDPSLATPARVAEVVDAATLRIADDGIVRLAAIAPPLPPLGRDEALPWPPAAAAQQRLAALVDGADIRLVDVADGADRYGRRVVQIFRADGRWVQAEMVANGHGRVRLEGGSDACLGRLLLLEDDARMARLGLWNEPEYAVRRVDDPSLSTRNGLYEIVEGRVVSVKRGRRMVFVDFGRDYWRDFSVMVPLAAVERFAAAGVPVEDLAGYRIRVRGILEESGGPAIRVYDPAAIEVLDDNGTAGEPG